MFADSQGGSQYVVHHQQQRANIAYGQQPVQQAAYDSRSVHSLLSSFCSLLSCAYTCILNSYDQAGGKLFLLIGMCE